MVKTDAKDLYKDAEYVPQRWHRNEILSKDSWKMSVLTESNGELQQPTKKSKIEDQ